jgi:hypothetical protein
MHRNSTNKNGSHFGWPLTLFGYTQWKIFLDVIQRTPSEFKEIKKPPRAIEHPTPVNGFRPSRSESPIDGG